MECIKLIQKICNINIESKVVTGKKGDNIIIQIRMKDFRWWRWKNNKNQREMAREQLIT